MLVEFTVKLMLGTGVCVGAAVGCGGAGTRMPTQIVSPNGVPAGLRICQKP